jgi:hypothetical protein
MKSLVYFGDSKTQQKIAATIYRKQIIKYGDYVNPNDSSGRMVLDYELGDKVISNFNRKVLDTVPIQFLHEEDPRNIVGNILALEHTNDSSGLDAIISVADEDTIKKLAKLDSSGQRLLRGVSVSLEEDYMDKTTGNRVGPVLRHVAIVTHGYLKGMRDYEPIQLGDEELSVDFYNFKEKRVKTSELVAELKKRGFNITDLSDLDDSADDSKKPDNDEPDEDDRPVKGKKKMADVTLQQIAELTESNKAVKTELADKDNKIKELTDRLNLEEAHGVVDKLIAVGKVVPAERDAWSKIYLTDKESFTALTANLAAKVDFTEKTTSPNGNIPGSGTSLSDTEASSEIDRLADLAKSIPTAATMGTSVRK